MRSYPEPEAVVLSGALREQKLAKLLELEGFKTLEELAEAVLSDAVSPAIARQSG